MFLQYIICLTAEWEHGCGVSYSVTTSCHIVFLWPSIPSVLVLDVVVMTVVRGLGCLQGRQLLPVLSITEC